MESGFQQGQNINTFTKVARRPFPWRTCECNMNIWLERSQSLQCLYFSWHEAVHISEILSAQRLGSIHSPSGKPQFTHGVQIRACRGEDSNATSALEHGFGPLSNWKNKKRSKINIHSKWDHKRKMPRRLSHHNFNQGWHSSCKNYFRIPNTIATIETFKDSSSPLVFFHRGCSGNASATVQPMHASQEGAWKQSPLSPTFNPTSKDPIAKPLGSADIWNFLRPKVLLGTGLNQRRQLE